MDNKKEINVFKFNDTFNEKIESYKNQISSLKNENYIFLKDNNK